MSPPLWLNCGLSIRSRTRPLRPDLAIVDIGLPGLDGFEVARRARSALGGAAPRLAALTGYSSLAVRRAALDAGFDLHLVKPLSMAALAEVLAGPAQA